MSPLLIKISKDFATLFTTINPIANLALFAGLTASLSRAERQWTALRACIGGVILFLFGLQMLFGKMDEQPGTSPEEGRDLAVFPLAVPSIAGGGAIMAAIVLTDDDVYTVPERIETGVVMVVVIFITYLLFLFSDAILRVIGKQGASVLVRIMGLILCSLAVEIVLTALNVGPWSAGALPH
jgi:multiple antibiotic resistance protein